MLKTRKKWISILLTLAMLVGLMVPLAAPAGAAAASYNQVTGIPNFDASDTSADNLKTATVQIKLDPAIETLSTARVEALASDGKQLDIVSVVDLTYSNVDPLTLKINDNTVAGSTYSVGGAKYFNIAFKPQLPANSSTATVNFALTVKAKDVASGDVSINFFSTTGQLVPGKVVVATAAGSAVTVALVGSAPTFGQDTAKSLTIRLAENAVNALKTNATDPSVKIKLPAGFKWSGTPSSSDASVNASIDSDARLLKIFRTSASAGTDPSTFDITANVGVDDVDVAKMGDVVATIEGGNSTSISPSEITVGKYADYGVNVTVASIKDLQAGKVDQKTDKITIEEAIKGSLIAGRNVTVTLPDWVKISSITDKNVSGINDTLPSMDGTKNKFSFSVTNPTDKAKLEFKLKLNIEAGETGDITAKVTGAGIPDTEVVIAKAVSPVTVTSQAKDVKIGVQGQEASDVIITEAAGGAIKQGTDRNLALILPEGVQFVGTPKVEVTEGDLTLKTDLISVTDIVYTSDGSKTYGTKRVLSIPVKSESLKASTIKISAIKLTVDRTVPEGDLIAKIGGYAVVETYGSGDNQFRTDAATEAKIANVVTPAPGGTKQNASFTIGSDKYIVNGVEATMDVAAYVKNGRTYLPIRYVAYALGISPENILWDGAKATIIGNGRVIQVAPWSNVITINGSPVTMDTVTEDAGGRIMVPFRWVAQAFGAQVNYDDATQTVSMTL